MAVLVVLVLGGKKHTAGVHELGIAMSFGDGLGALLVWLRAVVFHRACCTPVMMMRQRRIAGGRVSREAEATEEVTEAHGEV